MNKRITAELKAARVLKLNSEKFFLKDFNLIGFLKQDTIFFEYRLSFYRRFMFFRNLFKVKASPKESSLDLLSIELTSRCNLRCSYCTLSHPDYRGSDTELGSSEILHLCRELKPKLVAISDHGESTIFPNWSAYCRQILENGFSVVMTSNLTKTFSKEEIDTLSRIRVLVSIDSLDPLIFRKLRGGSEVEKVLKNVKAVITEAKEKNRDLMMGWRTVVSDQTIFGVVDLVRHGLDLGVKEFYFNHLQKMAICESPDSPIHLLNMHPEEQERVVLVLEQVQELLEDANVTTNFQSFLDLYRVGLQPIITRFENPSPTSSSPFEPAGRSTFTEPIQKGSTRDCLNPWTSLFVKHDGQMSFCCHMKPIGNLKGEAVKAFLNGDKAIEIREGLKNGKLNSDCLQCPVRSTISVENFNKKIKEFEVQ
jgi:MoaA/NifB/PqqE/SkfB family radical SAM enzyme